MTFRPDEYQLVIREYPMFSLWAVSRDVLFLHPLEEDEDESYDLMTKVYILMKRLGQSYMQILTMDPDDRDELFRMEMKLIKEEAKQKENGTSYTGQ